MNEELVICLVSHLRARKLRMLFIKVKSVTRKNVVIAIVRYVCVDIFMRYQGQSVLINQFVPQFFASFLSKLA